MSEPEFQIFQCENPSCRFRCPNNFTLRKMDTCPKCGSSFTPQGKPFSNARFFSNVENQSNSSTPKLEVVLDNLRSTLNVGSIFRTADGAGVQKIICCGTTPTPSHPKIGKTSLGAEGFIPWSYATNAVDILHEKKTLGFSILSLEMTATSSSIFEFSKKQLGQPAILVVGNEISGIDPEILALSDHILHIPMIGKKNSLNVSVAFGIAVYTLLN